MITNQYTVSRYLPQGKPGELALKRLAASIFTANELAPDRWGISCLKNFVRLNLGKIEVLTITPLELRVFVTDVEELGNAPSCPGRSVVVRDPEDLEVGYYKSVPGSALCYIDVQDCTNLETCLGLVEQPHLKLLRRAALTSRNPMTAKSHSIDAIIEIERLLGTMLSQPRYVG